MPQIVESTKRRTSSIAAVALQQLQYDCGVSVIVSTGFSSISAINMFEKAKAINNFLRYKLWSETKRNETSKSLLGAKRMSD